jgi:L-fuculose-phosphate aldolase
VSDRVESELIALAHRIGEPVRDLLIAGEGGLSMRVGSDAFVVAAAGADVATLGTEHLVRSSLAAALEALDAAEPDAVAAEGTEVLHAACLAESGASVVAHVHPPAVDALLCAGRGDALADGPLLPAHLAACGPHPLVIDRYPAPGVLLARAVRDEPVAHRGRQGAPPRVVYVAGHGLLALGQDAEDALRIASAAAKAARVLHEALAVGAPDALLREPLLLGSERREIVRLARQMHADGVTTSTSGNLSARAGHLVAITPTGVDPAALRPEGIGVHRLDGAPVDAPLRPSSEFPFHLAIYASTAAAAVVHTHSLHATVLSTLVDELPPIHYLLGLFGGSVRTVAYAPFGSDELARHITEGLQGRQAVLLANHGAVTTGRTLTEAYTRSLYLEWLCELFYKAQLMGHPRLVPTEEIERMVTRLDTYRRGAVG